MKGTDQEQKERLTPLGWYPWYPRDFYSSLTVRSMSFTARSIYRELLDLQWENGCLTDVKRLLSIMQITAEQYSEFAPFMDELFPQGVNPKLHLLREKALAEQEMKRIAGRKSAEARRLNEPKSKVKESAPQQEVNNSSAGAEQVLNISSTKHKHKHKQSNSFILKEYIEELSYSDEIKSLLISFVEHRNSMKKPLSLEALKLNLKKVSSCSEAELRESIEESLSLGWQGLFPPRYKKRALPQESNIQKVNRLMEGIGND
jgi:hypothetical protein